MRGGPARTLRLEIIAGCSAVALALGGCTTADSKPSADRATESPRGLISNHVAVVSISDLNSVDGRESNGGLVFIDSNGQTETVWTGGLHAMPVVTAPGRVHSATVEFDLVITDEGVTRLEHIPDDLVYDPDLFTTEAGFVAVYNHHAGVDSPDPFGDDYENWVTRGPDDYTQEKALGRSDRWALCRGTLYSVQRDDGHDVLVNVDDSSEAPTIGENTGPNRSAATDSVCDQDTIYYLVRRHQRSTDGKKHRPLVLMRWNTATGAVSHVPVTAGEGPPKPQGRLIGVWDGHLYWSAHRGNERTGFEVWRTDVTSGESRPVIDEPAAHYGFDTLVSLKGPTLATIDPDYSADTAVLQTWDARTGALRSTIEADGVMDELDRGMFRESLDVIDLELVEPPPT